MLECVQRRAAELGKVLEPKPEEQLRELGGGSAQRKGNLRVAFQYLKRACKKDREGLFTRACRDKTRGNSFKLKEG